MTLTPDEIIRIMQVSRYKADCKRMGDEEKMILITNYKKQLAELDTQYWFEHMPETEYIDRFDAISSRLHELERGDD